MAKNTRLPGMEGKSIPALTKAIEKHLAVKSERMLLTEKEVEARDLVEELMKKHGLTTYTDENEEVGADLSVEETVKTKRIEPPKTGPSDGKTTTKDMRKAARAGKEV